MVIGEHWIDYLESKGHLAECKPNAFEYDDEWLLLYTRAGVTKQISGLSPLLNAQGDSPLIAVIPPDMPFQYEWENVIHRLHKAECLARMSVYFDDNQRKQMAFCPYCGVMNVNSTMAYSHARKHLGMTFLCGGCYGKLYKALQHLFNHMKTCRPCVMSRPESSQRGGRANSEATATASCLQPLLVRTTCNLSHRGSFSVEILGLCSIVETLGLLLVLRPPVSVLCILL